MVKMIRDSTGRFAERPFYRERDLDDECERLIRELLMKRHGKVDYPVATDDLTVLIEMHYADLDPYANLSAYGADVEGVTEFFPDRGPKVSISEPRRMRCRTWRSSGSVPPQMRRTRSRPSSTRRSGPPGPWPRVAPAISSTP